jgi:hypothetical protein
MNDLHPKLRLLIASLFGVVASIVAPVLAPHIPEFQPSPEDSTLTAVTWRAFHLIGSIPFLLIYFSCLVLFVAFRYRRKDTWPAAFMGGAVLVRIIIYLVSLV